MGVQPYRPQAPPRAGVLPMQQPVYRAPPPAPAAAARPVVPSEDDKSLLPRQSMQLLLSSVDKEVTSCSRCRSLAGMVLLMRRDQCPGDMCWS